MRKLASIQRIAEKRPIEGADKIEAVRVQGWWVVAKKDEFQVDDLCVYFEIDSLLPDEPQYAFLKKGSTLKRCIVDGKEITGIRLKTIKLRGQVSQGLALPVEDVIKPKSLLEETGVESILYPDVEEGMDFTEWLGVHKYEPPIPACLSGKMKGGFPGFIPKTDEERVQNMPDLFNSFYVTEKLDGSSVTFYKKDGVFGVCSRNLELLEEGGGTQWKVARELDLENKIPDGFAFQGELVGEGIQKNPYKIQGHKVFFYNVYKIDPGFYLDFDAFRGMLEAKGLEIVPIVAHHFNLPSTIEETLGLSDGKSMINPEVEREGIVVRSKVKINGYRISFKAISNKYLLTHED